MFVGSLQSQAECTFSETKTTCEQTETRWNNFLTHLKSLAEHCDYGKEEDNQVRHIVISHVMNKDLKSKFYCEENLSLSQLLEIISTYHHKDLMAHWTVPGTTKVKVRKKQRASSHGRANVGNAIKRVTWRKISVSILAANVETMGTWKSVVVQNRINRAKEEAIADIEGNLEENGKTYERKATSLTKVTWKKAIPVKTMDTCLQHFRWWVNTLPLPNEPVNVIIDSGVSCNLMSEQVFNKLPKGKLDLLKTDRKVYAYASQEPLRGETLYYKMVATDGF